jgi:hypothetical protein
VCMVLNRRLSIMAAWSINLGEAEELIKGMPWKPDVVVILGPLLTSSKNNGNTEFAERVAKEILALEPHNHVALSNMYAEKDDEKRETQ